MASNVKHPKQAGKWWRKQPTSGKYENRRIYAAVGHVNPHAATGPSLLLQSLLIRKGRNQIDEFRTRVRRARNAEHVVDMV
jgi:hypothetical protein